MAGGPFFPHSAFPVNAGLVFPNFHVGAGATSKEDEGLGVANATDLTGDAIWRLRFQMPTTLPTGTATLLVRAIAALEAGDLSVEPKWASVASDEEPGAATMNTEGPDPDSRVGGDGSNADNSTFGWATGDDDKYIEARWTLNADTVVAAEEIVMDLTIDDGDSDHAAVVTLIVSIIFV